MDWFFNGLGTQIIMMIITLIGGGIVGYKIGIKKNMINQVQKAKNDAKQDQRLDISVDDEKLKDTKLQIRKNKFYQKQGAGDNATQTQIGGIHHE